MAVPASASAMPAMPAGMPPMGMPAMPAGMPPTGMPAMPAMPSSGALRAVGRVEHMASQKSTVDLSPVLKRRCSTALMAAMNTQIDQARHGIFFDLFSAIAVF